MNKAVLVCFAVALILSLYEFVGVARARATAKTQSTRRVVLRGMIFFTIAATLWQHLDWQRYVAHMTENQSLDMMRIGNTPFLFANIALGFVLFLTLLEMYSLIQAKRKGLTKNNSRLVSASVIFLCLIPILQETVDMWDRYTNKL